MRFSSHGNVVRIRDLNLDHEGSSSAADTLRHQWLPSVSEKLGALEINRITVALQHISRCVKNWDGRGSAAANQESIAKAHSFLATMFRQVLLRGFDWYEPRIGLDEHGDVVLEWWNRDKKLTIYVSPTSINYVLSWGPNIENDMVDGVLNPNTTIAHWRWLWANG